jgi:hypothetical protein
MHKKQHLCHAHLALVFKGLRLLGAERVLLVKQRSVV